MLVMFKACVLLILVSINIYSGVTGSTTCLSCRDAVQPRDCSTIERCGPSSNSEFVYKTCLHNKRNENLNVLDLNDGQRLLKVTCYIEAYVTSLGYPRFNLGCRDVLQCQTLDTDSHQRDEDLIYCEECCHGNLCNQQGCNRTGFGSFGKRGPICYNCSTQLSTDDCQNFKICRPGEVCKLKRTLYGPSDEIRYETKCEYQKTCEDEVKFYQPTPVIGKRYNQDFSLGSTCMIQCCDTDLCNSGCSKPPMVTTPIPTPVKKPIIDVFTPNATYKFFKLGSRIKLACDSSSFPVPKIEWTGSFSDALSLSISRKNITLSSLQPSQLGNYTCTATNIYGATSRTITITSNVTGALDCDFETTYSCLWTNNHMDGGDWLNSGSNTHKSSSAVYASISKETGYFLFSFAHGLLYDRVVDLVSPQLRASEHACLSFLYKIYPHDKVQLHVQVETSCDFGMICNSSMPLTVVLNGRQDTRDWQLARIPIPAITNRHRLFLKSIHQGGTADNGFSAIDDIKYYKGACKQTMSLTGSRYVLLTVDQHFPIRLNSSIYGYPIPFYTWRKVNGCGNFNNVTESTVTIVNQAGAGDGGTYICSAENSGPFTDIIQQHFIVTVKTNGLTKCTFEHDLCGWKQLIEDDFDWIRNSGPTTSQFTGPTNDHTHGNGTYLYAEASSPRRSGETAILRSPRQASSHPICVSFYYHMYGNDTGQLIISLKDTCSGLLTVIFNKTGTQGSKWLHGTLNIPANYIPNDYYIEIKAVIGQSYHGDIAIDDILIHPDTCHI